MKHVYDFEPDVAKRFLKKHGARRVALQLPAGLRPHLMEIEEALVDVKTVVLADSCYGACDIADSRAKQLGCDVLVHYGHADLGLRTCLPTLYVEARMDVDPTEAVEKALRGQKFERLGVVATVQHVGVLQQVENIVRSRGIEPLIGKPGPRAKYPGQILGCDWGAARSVAGRVDAFLYVGTGRFHPLGVCMATGKEVLVANPVAKGSEKVTSDIESFLKSRKAAISRAAACDSFGILVSTKPGQARFKLATTLASKFKGAGLDARVLVMDEITPEKLGDFTQLGAFVCAACPRIATDDAELFDRPILTPFEAMAMLGKASVEPYQMDEVLRSDF